MNIIHNDIHKVRNKLKILELKLFNEAKIDDKTFDSISDISKALFDLENKVVNAMIILPTDKRG